MTFIVPDLDTGTSALSGVQSSSSFGPFKSAVVKLSGKVPVIGGALQTYIAGSVDGSQSDAISSYSGQMAALGSGFKQVTHMVATLTTNTRDAISHVGDQIAQIYNVTIPTFRNAAENYTDTQVGVETNRAEGKETFLQAYMNGLVEPTVQGAIDDTRNTLNGTISTVQTNLQNNITAEVNRATTAEGDISDTLNTGFTNVWDAITPLQTAVVSTIPDEFASAAATTQAEIAASQATEQANLVTATQNLQTELDNIQTEINANDQLIAIANGQIATLNRESSTYATDIDTLNGQISTAQSNISALQTTATSLQTQITTNTTAINTATAIGTITIPQTGTQVNWKAILAALGVGALAASVADLVEEAARCFITSCDGPNNLANQLQSILGLVDLAGFGSFISGAISNPAQAITDTYNAAQGIQNDAESTLSVLESI